MKYDPCHHIPLFNLTTEEEEKKFQIIFLFEWDRWRITIKNIHLLMASL
jgi:hypothetical protein